MAQPRYRFTGPRSEPASYRPSRSTREERRVHVPPPPSLSPVELFAIRMSRGVPMTSRADLQFYQNHAQEIEDALRRLAHRDRGSASRDTRKKARNVWRQFRQGLAARPQPKIKKSTTKAARKGPALTERQRLGQQAFLRKQRKAYRARMMSEEGAFEPIGGRTHLEHLGAREEYRQAPWYKRFAKKQARRAYKGVSGWAERAQSRSERDPPTRKTYPYTIRDSRGEVLLQSHDRRQARQGFADLARTLMREEREAEALGAAPVYYTISYGKIVPPIVLLEKGAATLIWPPRGRDPGWTARDVTRDWPGQPIRHKRAAKLGWRRRRRRAGRKYEISLPNRGWRKMTLKEAREMDRLMVRHGKPFPKSRAGLKYQISLPGRGWRKMTLKEAREMDRLMVLHGKPFPKRRKSRKRTRRDRW